jgi:hypothetical protein
METKAVPVGSLKGGDYFTTLLTHRLGSVLERRFTERDGVVVELDSPFEIITISPHVMVDAVRTEGG